MKKIIGLLTVVLAVIMFSLYPPQTVEARTMNDCCENGYKLWNSIGDQGFESCGCSVISFAEPTTECSCSSNPGEGGDPG
jgi:hypothetical protein